VANERIQLETLIIEQQLSFSSVSRLYEQLPRSDSRLLTETDSSQSLVAIGRGNMLPSPHDLYRYQDRSLASLNASDPIQEKWLPAVCNMASPRSEHLLERWTSLPQFDNLIRDAEQKERTNKRDSQQPTVESDSEEERPSFSTNGAGLASRSSRRSGSVQPLFTDTTTLPIPVPGSQPGSAPPPSPAASPRASRNTFDYPSSPRSSTASLPVEAATAVEAKVDDDDVSLEIPWRLCTRKYYWKYIDTKLDDSNTNLPPSTAFSERQSWTELAASWVCKQALDESGLRFTQVQKERRDGRRTRFETCFCIEQPLHFTQVKRLVERTVEIYRQNNPPPPRVRRTSFDRPAVNTPKGNMPDRDRTPMPPRSLPLDRSTSSLPYHPPPPPLDRSLSTPGSNAPPYGNPPVQMPVPHGVYPPPYPQHPPFHLQPQSQPQPPYNSLPPHPYLQPNMPPQSSLRHPHSSYTDRYDDDSLTSDSGSGAGRERARRRREKSRGRHEKGKGRRMGKSAAVGTLMGIGGLTALLDGLSGL
jgi:hypothetical protein